MPNKTAKTAAKARGSKAPASKVAASRTAPKTVARTAAKAAAKAAVKPVAHKPAAKPAAVAPRVEEPKKVLTQRQGFKTNEFVVYPAHGVGQILAIEDQEIAGAKLEVGVFELVLGHERDVAVDVHFVKAECTQQARGLGNVDVVVSARTVDSVGRTRGWIDGRHG